MKKKLVILFLASLVIVEAFSFFWVFESNRSLQNTLMVLADTGQPMVPNQSIAPSLGKIMPAFCASLFITFTAGLFISLMVCLLVFFKQKRSFKSLAIRLSPPGIAVAGSIILLVMVADSSIFLRTRDYLFLSNSLGRALSHAYYTYSPHVVNAVAPPLQKHVKPVWVSSNVLDRKNIINILSRFGWFQIETPDQATFRIEKREPDLLAFLAEGTPILTVSSAAFLGHPGHYLKHYSQKTDTAVFIRALCMAGLFLGLPVFIFFCLFKGLSFLTALILPQRFAGFISGILVLCFTTALSFYLYPGPPKTIDKAGDMVFSKNSRDRIESLRFLHGKGGDWGKIPGQLTARIHTSGVAQRYWTVKALSGSKDPGSILLLKSMVNDPAIIVASAAVKSLSKGGHCELIPLFEKLAANRPEWYVQIAAYNAVKKCR